MKKRIISLLLALVMVMGITPVTILTVIASDSNETPFVPWVPDTPDTPTEPDTPDVPNEPDTPDIPTQPETPDIPTQPETPDIPTQPEIPDIPTQPETPDVPTEPDTPDIPAQPDIPDVPTKPDTPDVPAVPETSDKDDSVKEVISDCPKKDTCPLYHFTDLDTSGWYHDGIHYCLENSLMNGTEAVSFTPDTATSRAMIVTILWRLEGNPVVNYLMEFEDVASDTWYTESIRWAASEGIVNGYSKTLFGTNDAITREQLAAILYRYEQKKGGGFTGTWMFRMEYADLNNVSDWAYEAMCWMVMNEIINGKPGNLLAPKAEATRAEAATVFFRFCK